MHRAGPIDRTVAASPEQLTAICQESSRRLLDSNGGHYPHIFLRGPLVSAPQKFWVRLTYVKDDTLVSA